MAASAPEVRTGHLDRLGPIASRHVAARELLVWLPPGYEQGAPCNVLYMHDGFNLFDARSTWNHQAWDVDVAITRLMAAGQLPPTLVVGIPNAGKQRHAEYFPQRVLDAMPPAARARHIHDFLADAPQADAYLRFLVQEVKPLIDSRYRTRPDAAHTFVMGSSMGGLISLYALSEYPQVFGGAAALSTHWPGTYAANSAIPLATWQYLQGHLPDPATHRLYMDHGTVELDALYPPYQAFVNQLVKDRGYTEANFMSRVFEGQGHNERAWAARLDGPLMFLAGTTPAPARP